MVAETGEIGWEILEKVANEKDPHRDFYKCKCRCGSIRVVQGSKLRAGRWKTCGCTSHVHGMAPEEKLLRPLWSNMIQRCTDPDSPSYDNYGGRGIGVCDAWLVSFAVFVADVGLRPSLSHSLDRINNNGNYEPGNVRWATKDEQSKNKRTNRNIEADGVTLCVEDWARRLGCTASVIHQRLIKGWAESRAVTTPVKTHSIRGSGDAPAVPDGGWRASTLLTVGEATRSVADWSEQYGMTKAALLARLKKGWPAESAVTTPVNDWKASDATTAK